MATSERLEELLLIIALRFDGDASFGAVRLHKAVYFSDAAMFRACRRTISGAAFIKKPQGPWSPDIEAAVVSLRNKMRGFMAERVVYAEYTQRVLTAVELPKLELFSLEEIGIIGEVTEAHKGLSAKQASDLAHEERAWALAALEEPLPSFTFLLGTERRKPTPEEIERGVSVAAAIVPHA